MVLHISQCLDIAEGLRQHPEMAPNVYEHLSALGVDWDRVGGSSFRASPASGRDARPVIVDDASTICPGDDDTLDSLSDADYRLPTCYTEVSMLSDASDAEVCGASGIQRARSASPRSEGKVKIPKPVCQQIFDYVLNS